MRRILLSAILFLVSVLGVFAQKTLTVDAEYTYRAPEDVALSQAKRTALDRAKIQAIAEGREAMGETLVKLRSEGKLYSGRGISTDIVGSSVMAYLSALNKIVFEEEEQ